MNTMNTSYNFNDPDIYTSRIRIVTNKSVELVPTSDVSTWRGIFYNYMMYEKDSFRKKDFDQCHFILTLAISCCASSVRVSCCADHTGISIVFDFTFGSSVHLNAFREGMDRKSVKDDNPKALLKF